MNYKEKLPSAKHNGEVSSLKTHVTYKSVSDMKKAESSSFINPKGVFQLIFAVILSVSLIRIAFGLGSGALTFTSLFDYLSTMQVPQIDLHAFNLNITADWGLFNGFR